MILFVPFCFLSLFSVVVGRWAVHCLNTISPKLEIRVAPSISGQTLPQISHVDRFCGWKRRRSSQRTKLLLTND